MKWEEAEQRQVLEEDESQGDYWDFVQTKGTQFMVNDLPFYINGFNTYWLMVFSADPSTKPKISEVFQQAASVGLTVARTWAFNDGGWRALQKSPGVYDEDVFKALDFVISEAQKNNIRLILSLCNNWGAYGGKSQYVKWGLSAGLKLSSDDAFFADPTLKTYFKDHIKKVLTRVNTITDIAYKDDPTIFAWELMNEPRCTSDPSGDTLQEWITEMAVYIAGSHNQFLHLTSPLDPGYNSSYRETFIQTVYDNIMLSAKKGGAGAGSLIWQLFPEGVEYMADGYEVVLSKSPSIAKIMKEQSVSLWALSSVCKWSFKWSCRRDVINSPAFISLTADLLGGVEAAHEL
ncbi:hypothetical protein SUGI_0286660 [Cryptomeria japonica]|nr:hypothetical protein SUGI_0286660 [Cryptomeria japonica]